MAIDLRPGTVLAYPYLWQWQKERDETAGRKERPVSVLLALTAADGLTHLALLAISSRPPGDNQSAVAVPEMERRRAGLDVKRAAWVTVSEYNYDVAERSFHLDKRQEALGSFSTAFMQKIISAAAPLFQRGGSRIDRTR